MNFEHIKFTLNNGIAVLTLNRPEKLNSFTQAMHLEVRTALAAVKTSPTARVLLFPIRIIVDYGIREAICVPLQGRRTHVLGGHFPPPCGFAVQVVPPLGSPASATALTR